MGNFNMLPLEIMLDILSRVPTESVLKCKLVSKPWRALLQYPSFSHMHLNHLSDHDSGKLSFVFNTLWSDREPVYYTEYDADLNCFSRTTKIKLRPLSENCYMLGSCNGLICFGTYFDNIYLQPAYICNPITREYIVLPNLEEKAFMFGFGYNPSTNEYKVVRICRSWRDPNYGIIQVYTVGSGSGWRYGRKMDYDVMWIGIHGVFADAAIHWVDSKGTIVAFDLIDEEFRKVPSPPCLSPAFDLHVLGVFLCARYCSAGCFDIWVSKKNISNHEVIWSKEFTIRQSRPITFTKNGELLCYYDKNVYRYAPKALFSRMLVKFGKFLNAVVPHNNTLVSLKALGEEDTKLMDSKERAQHLVWR